MILVLNCGSQTIKYKVFDEGLKLVKEGRGFRELKEISWDIKMVGHRVVHGGKEFRDPVLINKQVLNKLKGFNKLAPLHNPYNILGIKKALKIFPGAKHFAVFDTGFYKYLPDVARIYPVPGNYERFGFHGISHEYVAREAAKAGFGKLKIISCHLGGGASITAIKNGKVIDTSMGFTPLEGLMMMTRAGDIDPGVVMALGKKANRILNYESGIKNICQEEEMLKVLKRNDKKAKLALEMFCYKIKKYIGAYYAILGGCDILVFTGAIGFGSAKIRKMICSNLDILKNTKILAIKPNEELAIAKKIIYNR